MSKIGREIYRWNGFGQLKKTLAFLRVTAEKLAMPSEISKLEEKNKDEYFAAAMVWIVFLNYCSISFGDEIDCQ